MINFTSMVLCIPRPLCRRPLYSQIQKKAFARRPMYTKNGQSFVVLIEPPKLRSLMVTKIVSTDVDMSIDLKYSPLTVHSNCNSSIILASYSIPRFAGVVSSLLSSDIVQSETLSCIQHSVIAIFRPSDFGWWISCYITVKSDTVSFNRYSVGR